MFRRTLLAGATTLPLWGPGSRSWNLSHASSAPTGALTVSGGQIQNNGAPFVFKGLAVLSSTMGVTPPAGIKALYANNNAIMLAIGADGGGYQSAQPNAQIVAYVQAANAVGMWVGLSDYVPGQPQARSGKDLQNSLNWYTSLAKATAGLNVFWTTENEVGGNLNAMFSGIYNAIRGAGNNGLILLGVQNGNPGSTAGMSPSTVAGMTDVAWNVHFYPWSFTSSGLTQADFNNRALSYVSLLQGFAPSRDGAMPVVMGEGGNSTSGNHSPIDDPVIGGKFATVQATLNVLGKNPGLSGALFWIHDWHGGGGDADTLVVSGTLTKYGQQVAAGFAT